MFGISAFSQSPFSSLPVTSTVIGQQINTSLGTVTASFQVADGWGRGAWSSSVWGTSGTAVPLTGEQLNISLNSVTLSIDGNVDLTGEQLNISQGTVDANPDANIIGQQINVLLNSVTPIGNANVDLIGQQLNISQGDETTSISVDVPVYSIVDAGWGQVAWGTQDWGQGELNINLSIAEGEVDPSPDATVVGIGMSITLGLGTVVAGSANVFPVGQQLNIAEQSVTIDLNTPVDITPLPKLAISLSNVVAGISDIALVTGNALTIALNNNNVNVQVWTIINTGTDANWSGINTGTDAAWTNIDTPNVTWNEVDTAA